MFNNLLFVLKRHKKEFNHIEAENFLPLIVL